jgi:threonine dehydrogenase-like Zn-dependent dehydrogenase
VPECLSLGVRAPFELEVFRLELPAPRAGEVLVRTLYSGVSAGTELTYVKGTDPGFTSHRDPERGVFVPGEPSRTYPVRSMGYMEVGEVVESHRPDLPVGTVVGSAYGHRSCHVLGEGALAVPLPDGVDPLVGIYLAQMGPICANGVLHATAELAPSEDPALGDGVRDRNVLVTGAGVVGVLTALFARLHGARSVVVADPDPARLATAASLGLQVLDERETSASEWCKQEWVHGAADRGADLVLQCRARSSVLHEALRALRPQGTVIDLAFYTGGADDLRLGEEFHHNGLTIRCAQINRVPRGFAHRWDRPRLALETGRLLQAYDAALAEHLVTDVVPFSAAADVILAIARGERPPGQVVVDFTGGAAVA